MMAKVHGIAGKDFVASVPAQRYRYVLARESRQQKCWHQRRIANRLVHPRADFADQGRGQTGAEPLFMVNGAEKLGHPARVWPFVERAFGKSDRKRLNLFR